MSADGQTIFFTDESKLTAGSTAESKAPDLYECVLPTDASECQLTDLTPEATLAKTGEHADVLGVSSLGSADSSHVYFTAKGVLAENKREYEYTDTETGGTRRLKKPRAARTTCILMSPARSATSRRSVKTSPASEPPRPTVPGSRSLGSKPDGL